MSLLSWFTSLGKASRSVIYRMSACLGGIMNPEVVESPCMPPRACVFVFCFLCGKERERDMDAEMWRLETLIMSNWDLWEGYGLQRMGYLAMYSVSGWESSDIVWVGEGDLWWTLGVLNFHCVHRFSFVCVEIGDFTSFVLFIFSNSQYILIWLMLCRSGAFFI